MKNLAQNLRQLKDRGLYRSLKPTIGVDLSSNDYLCFAAHPVMMSAAREAIDSGLSLGASGSRLLRGNNSVHENLENFAAQYFNAEKALFFSNGYQANTAIFQTLPSRHDVIVFDALIHASARDGIQASSAKHERVAHNDLSAYELAFKKHHGKAQQIWVAVESVYSMDGDFAPLEGLYKLAREYNACLIVDEAHATGIYGSTGKGCSEGMPHDDMIVLHTCGKALGVAGGLVCGTKDLIETLINTARPFIYSTAPMPLQAYLVQRALELLQSEEGQQQRQKLHVLIKYARERAQQFDAFLLHNEVSQILPYIVGESEKAVALATKMQTAGYDVRAIRPPTVAKGAERLRFSLNAGLDEAVLDAMFDCLEKEIL